MDDEEDEDIYTFQTPIKTNVNVALEVEASSTFRSRSMPRKPPPPPVSPSPKGNGMFFYSLDDDDGDMETKGFETSQLNNEEDVKILKVKGGSRFFETIILVQGMRSLAKRGLTKKSDRLKCPRCGKEDFDSKAMYNSHARNCKRGLDSSMKKSSASPAGFGRMGLLLQIRRLQEEEERKKAEALEQKRKRKQRQNVRKKKSSNEN